MRDNESTRYIALGSEFVLTDLSQLELLSAMMQRGVPLRTKVLGFSMTPLIRDEDVVTIAPLSGREPQVGEVVACVLPGTETLRVHRIVGRTGPVWLLRGDSCRESDGVVALDDIMGRVVRVERNGREVRFGRGFHGACVAWLSRRGVLAGLNLLRRGPRSVASQLLQRAQGLVVYRTIGRRMAPSIHVAELSHEDSDTLRRYLRSVRPRTRPGDCSEEDVTEWVARIGGTLVGFVQLVRRNEIGSPRTGYWLYALSIRVRYRGLGIGETLTRAVMERARLAGAAVLSLLVMDDNRAAIALYGKLGFEQVGIETLEPTADEGERRTDRKRVVMRKVLA